MTKIVKFPGCEEAIASVEESEQQRRDLCDMRRVHEMALLDAVLKFRSAESDFNSGLRKIEDIVRPLFDEKYGA